MFCIENELGTTGVAYYDLRATSALQLQSMLYIAEQSENNGVQNQRLNRATLAKGGLASQFLIN